MSVNEQFYNLSQICVTPFNIYNVKIDITTQLTYFSSLSDTPSS